ncbi:MAG: alpha/beta fold hydrolase [Alphaproteobacteria bacterium]|jgi:pimeloyl-ACP methyl ester carboxylesterase
MKSVTVRGAEALYFDAGQAAKEGQRSIVFLHGSGCDHSVWALQSRYFAFHGWNLYAVNLPAHGVGQKVSGGAPLDSVEAMADWTIDFLDAVGEKSCTLVGHSMGALVALDAAGRYPDRVEHLIMVGATAKMPVHPELLRASADREEKAVDLMMDWGHGPSGHKGGNINAGTWAKGGAKRMVMPRVADGVLGLDMAACNAYEGGEAAVGALTCRTSIISAQRDKMTPPRNGKAIADAVQGAAYILLPEIGHFMLGEAPNASLGALKQAVR